MAVDKGTFDHINWAMYDDVYLDYCSIENQFCINQILDNDVRKFTGEYEDEDEIIEILKMLKKNITDEEIKEMLDHVFG